MKAKVWLYPGMAGWHFIYVGKSQSKEIKESLGGVRRGFGSVPVTATVGKTSWDTSIFPDKSGAYLLPLKALVRRKEGIFADKTITFSIVLRS